MKNLFKFSLIVVAMAMFSCKKEKVEPVTITEYQNVYLDPNTEAHIMYDSIRNHVYQSILNPRLRNSANQIVVLPNHATIFDGNIDNGEFVLVERDSSKYELHIMFYGKSYQVDSLGSQIIYCKNTWNVVPN